MPAAGRSCRQPVRHSVRLSGPRRRRRRLSPDAWGPPSAARSSRGPARRRAPPPPSPALPPPSPSVRRSTRPPALPSFCPAASPLVRLPAPPALSLPGSLSLCLCPRGASQPLPRSPISGSPQCAPLIPQPPFLSSILRDSPSKRPRVFGDPSFSTSSTLPQRSL